MKQQIQFKKLLLTYKRLHTGLPSYLNLALVSFYSPIHSTRSSSANLIPSTKTCSSSHTSKSHLNYSFDYIAPRNWNSLPDIVRLAPTVWPQLSGPNCLAPTVWPQLSGPNCLAPTVWPQLSGPNCLAPTVWPQLSGPNCLDPTVRKRLKTSLFWQAFSPP